MMIGRIYKITNTVNGKEYIGQTVKTIDYRFKKHIKSAIVNNSNYIIHRAIRKYGKEKFIIEIIEDDIVDSDLDSAERYWIEWYELAKKFNVSWFTINNVIKKKTWKNV